MAGATVDLVETIDWSQLECLNEQAPHPAAHCLKAGYREDEGLFLESDSDEQLLLNIHFNQKVRIHSIAFAGPADTGPKLVKLFANRISMGFSDAESMPPDQQLSLTAKDLKSGDALPLKLTKFNSVTVLTILIDSNQSGADTTKVFKIALAGTAHDSFDVSAIKKQEEQQ